MPCTHIRVLLRLLQPLGPLADLRRGLVASNAAIAIDAQFIVVFEVDVKLLLFIVVVVVVTVGYEGDLLGRSPVHLVRAAAAATADEQDGRGRRSDEANLLRSFLPRRDGSLVKVASRLLG